MSYNNNNNYLITTTILIIITTVYLLLNIIPIAFSIDEDTEFDTNCGSSNKTFTSSFNETRELVVMDVVQNTGSNKGFRNAWARDGEEWAYAQALCRGDVSADKCTTCVKIASTTLINSTYYCSENRSGIIWRNYCSFKYSDVYFSGMIDTANNYSISSGSELQFSNIKDVILDLMNSLSKTAIESTTLLYASGSSEQSGGFTTDPTLYGMVQCTRDLSISDCGSCLETAINQLPDFKNGRYYTGSRVLYGSCNVRYDTHNFLTSS